MFSLTIPTNYVVTVDKLDNIMHTISPCMVYVDTNIQFSEGNVSVV